MAALDLASIKSLPTDEKRKLLVALVQDLTARRTGPVSVKDPAGEVIAFVVNPTARAVAEEAMRNASEEEIAEMRRLANDLDNTLSLDEVLNLPDEPDEASGR